MVSENSQASVLWTWLKDSGPANLPGMHVVNITWFTDSMRERRPVAVETRHLIQVGIFPGKNTLDVGHALDGATRQKLKIFNIAKCDILVDTTTIFFKL